MQTARFAAVVARSGRPLIHLVFAAPEKDATLQSAVRAERVMTIHQEHVGTRKDYGRVGFHPEPHAQVLIFPRSLKPFAEKRIVGIDFSLVDEPAALPRPAPRRAPAPRPAATRVTPRFQFTAPPPKTTAPMRLPPPHPRTAPRAAAPAAKSPAAAALRRAVKLAVQELKDGKAVAAYERLQAALRESGG
jgi:hypothetical protein